LRQSQLWSMILRVCTVNPSGRGFKCRWSHERLVSRRRLDTPVAAFVQRLQLYWKAVSKDQFLLEYGALWSGGQPQFFVWICWVCHHVANGSSELLAAGSHTARLYGGTITLPVHRCKNFRLHSNSANLCGGGSREIIPRMLLLLLLVSGGTVGGCTAPQAERLRDRFRSVALRFVM
jgi:hypothetical protein